MPSSRQSGITLHEVIILLSVIIVLVAVLSPFRITTSWGSGKDSRLGVLANMKQLHLVTQHMALDGLTTGNTNLGWPGDTGSSFSNWARQLTRGYLQTNELCSLLSAPGLFVPPGRIARPEEAALLVYAVKENSSGDNVFLTTVNFTNSPTGGQPLMKGGKPFEDSFLVFRKGGDGAILLHNQVGQTNIIGTFAPPCGP